MSRCAFRKKKAGPRKRRARATSRSRNPPTSCTTSFVIYVTCAMISLLWRRLQSKLIQVMLRQFKGSSSRTLKFDIRRVCDFMNNIPLPQTFPPLQNAFSLSSCKSVYSNQSFIALLSLPWNPITRGVSRSTKS